MFGDKHSFGFVFSHDEYLIGADNNPEAVGCKWLWCGFKDINVYERLERNVYECVRGKVYKCNDGRMQEMR